MKTEKRHAKVGERILIVREYPGGEPYNVGDIFLVEEVEDPGLLEGYIDVVAGMTDPEFQGIAVSEYEVIIEEETEHAKA